MKICKSVHITGPLRSDFATYQLAVKFDQGPSRESLVAVWVSYQWRACWDWVLGRLFPKLLFFASLLHWASRLLCTSTITTYHQKHQVLSKQLSIRLLVSPSDLRLSQNLVHYCSQGKLSVTELLLDWWTRLWFCKSVIACERDCECKA